jgi:hypothetical protein
MVCHSYHHAWIKEKQFRKRILQLKIQLFVFMKNLAKQLVLVAQSILKLSDSQIKTLGDRSLLTSESESEMFLKDLPLRQRPVKSACLRLTFSSSSELEESSLEKLKSLKAAHAQDMIF